MRCVPESATGPPAMTEADSTRGLQQSLAAALGALAAGTGTLVCCVLPAVMVSLGAGAALAGLVTAVPGLIWLSEHKALVFSVAGALLVVAAILGWRARRLPCPADPALARTCRLLRRASECTFWLAVTATVSGAVFAFVVPLVSS